MNHNRKHTPAEDRLELPGDAPLPGTVRLLKTLRSMPPRRITYEGVWGDTPVIVKRMHGWFRGKFAAKKEHKSLLALREAGFSAPNPLYFGVLGDGDYLLITQKIDAEVSFREELDNADTAADKVNLVHRFIELLALMHDKGVEQRDLHPGNFIRDDKEDFWVLDSAQIRFHSVSIVGRKALSQLGLVLAQNPELSREQWQNLIETYYSTRQWRLKPGTVPYVEKRAEHQEEKLLKSYVKKCQRENTRHIRRREEGSHVILNRKFASVVSPEKLVAEIEDYMQAGTMLKDGNTSTVVKARIGERDVVIKRYNHKGVVHSIRQSMKKSRARWTWVNGHMLDMLRIQGAMPIAMLETLRFGVVYNSYVITEFIDAAPLSIFLEENVADSSEDKKFVAQRVLNLLNRLKARRIIHGDLKYTNILVLDYTPYFTDVDAMRKYRSEKLFKRRWHKEWNRFLRNWEDNEELQALFVSTEKDREPIEDNY